MTDEIIEEEAAMPAESTEEVEEKEEGAEGAESTDGTATPEEGL